MIDRRIVAIDDEESVLKTLRHAFEHEGFEVHTAPDAANGAILVDAVRPDLVVLDVLLPDRSGLDLAREIRKTSNVPIVMLSARADEVDRILGLEFGADDYVAKPFSPRELVGRVKAILRRAERGGGDPSRIALGILQIDLESRQVRVRGAEVRLTASEYAILHLLARHPSKAFSRTEILEALREEAPLEHERAVDAHIHNLREKLEADPANPEVLLTERGLGYRLDLGG